MCRKTKIEPAYGNKDLLGEFDSAKKASVAFVFSVPELFEQFRVDDKIANAARDRTRSIGTLAVLFVFVALVSASSNLLGHGSGPWRTGFAVVAVVLGVLGTVLGLWGMSRLSGRRQWLRYRLKTEMLRLFHFHFMAANLPAILAASGNPAAEEAYVAQRQAAFARLKADVFREPETELEHIIDRDREYDFNTLAPPLVATGAITPVAADLFAAWHEARLDWQGGYANAKLKKTSPVWNPLKSVKAFTNLGWACVVAIFLLHVVNLGVYGISFWRGVPDRLPEGLLEFLLIVIAMAALALRAMEEGSQPHREVERYEGYRANVRVATERFDAATDVASKADAMRGFERTSLEEMRVFLRTHAEAKFLV